MPNPSAPQSFSTLVTTGANSEKTTANIRLSFPTDSHVLEGESHPKFIDERVGWAAGLEEPLGWVLQFNYVNPAGAAPLDDAGKLARLASIIRNKNLCPSIKFVLGQRDDPRSPGQRVPVLYGMSGTPHDEAAVEMAIFDHRLGINGATKLMNDLWNAQHRTQFLSAFVEDDTMCFASWTRSQVVVTPWFNYVEQSYYLVPFLKGADEFRAKRWNQNVVFASHDEERLYAQKLNNDVYRRAARTPSHLLKTLAGKFKTYKVSAIPLYAVLPKQYLIRAPLTTPEQFFGKGSRTYAAWDIEAERFVQLTESWDLREAYALDRAGLVVQKMEDTHVWTVKDLLLPLWDGISNLQSVVRLFRDILQVLMFTRHGNIARETVLINLELNPVLIDRNGYSDTPSGWFFRPAVPEADPVPPKELESTKRVADEKPVYGPDDDLASMIWLLIDTLIHLFPGELPKEMVTEYQVVFNNWEQLKKADRQERKTQMLRKIRDRTWCCKDPLFKSFLQMTVNRILSTPKGPPEQGATKTFDWYINECNFTLQRWNHGAVPMPGPNILGLE